MFTGLNVSAYKKVKVANDAFKKEVDITKALSESGISPKLIAATKNKSGQIDGYEMEFLGDHRPMGSRDISKALFQGDRGLLKQIATVHQKNIAHGDLHGENILAKNGKTKLIDFGMSEYIDKSDRGINAWHRDMQKLHAYAQSLEGEMAKDKLVDLVVKYSSRVKNTLMRPDLVKAAYQDYKQELDEVKI
jgi:tRNA A-37 threonylcarbamoyl transferase component Bud32